MSTLEKCWKHEKSAACNDLKLRPVAQVHNELLWCEVCTSIVYILFVFLLNNEAVNFFDVCRGQW